MERRFGRPRPCQRNIKRTVASTRTCCVCPILIIPRLPFCKASVRLPPSEPTHSRSTTSLLQEDCLASSSNSGSFCEAKGELCLRDSHFYQNRGRLSAIRQKRTH